MNHTVRPPLGVRLLHALGTEPDWSAMTPEDRSAVVLIPMHPDYRDLPGAVGPVEHVRALMDERTARGAPPAHLTTSERIFQLTGFQVCWP